MKPSQIAQIIIRLFAISWFLQGIVQTLGGFTIVSQAQLMISVFLPGATALAISVSAWVLAPTIGNLIYRGSDTEEIIAGITFQQVLHAMFIGIGLYFCATSIGGLLNGLHFFVVLNATPESIPSGMQLTLYDFTKPALSFLAGAFLIGSARHWSRKISTK